MIVQTALSYQKRELIMLLRAKPINAKLIFVLTPFAGISQKPQTSEEQELFSINEQIQGDFWVNLKNGLAEMWPLYCQEAKSFCRENAILCYDLNEQPYRGWTYVDHVHMTDSGYRQTADHLLHWVS